MPDDSFPIGQRQDFNFSASSRNVRAVLLKVAATLAENLSEDQTGTVELALAEALNNIVEHAYADLPPGPIRLSLTQKRDAVICQIRDEGRPMPNLRPPNRGMQKVASRTEDLAESGWGWSLIRALTTNLRYQRHANHNHLKFHIPVVASA